MTGMERLRSTGRQGDGIIVTWEENGREMTASYSFAQLIDLRVNALDIINNPGNYAIDGKTGRIRYVAFCQPSRHPELQE